MDFSEIYRRYAPHVHRFSIYLSGNPARAEDLAAETFVHALCGRTSLRDTVKAYLFGIARNLYRDLIERQRRMKFGHRVCRVFRLALLVWYTILEAQINRGAIEGIVTDPADVV
jgi:DNA-directed RNA polymerase specialized sigma24 family protein